MSCFLSFLHLLVQNTVILHLVSCAASSLSMHFNQDTVVLFGRGLNIRRHGSQHFACRLHNWFVFLN